ncbi:hypothetical protein FQA39_LY00163 [Lamprigera yunnana]|nr:hypothetical protein FQA39_LY00163 [Lamprigera yunnana]
MRHCTLFLLFVCVNGYYPNDTVIETPSGAIKGFILKTTYSQPIYAFLGVKFGRLIGNDRTRLAELVPKWDSVYNATEYHDPCPLNNATNVDCLFLNIYTTKLPESLKDAKHPVIVILNPAGYLVRPKLDFQTKMYLDTNMLIVSINFRQPPFALKDEELAFKWIKRNVGAFGGNVKLITAAVYNIPHERVTRQLSKFNGNIVSTISLPPVPADKWTDVYDATADAPACPQPVIQPNSEDCLFLNVYSTKLPHGHHNPKRPVVVYIHPGGFYIFTGRSDWTGPQYLLDQDVVLVTLNYRLGALGFLSTGDKFAVGNNGMKDQVLALKWVNENILAFGGDPNSVTLVGCSAGGISVTAHMLSPMSKGLFHKGVAMSDTFFAQWPLGNHQLRLAQQQARLVGCPDDTSENIVNCLKNVSAKAFGDSFFGFAEYNTDPVLLWTPVIELDFGQERFLIEHPIKTVHRGDFAKIPFMTGITTEEFSYYERKILTNPEVLKLMNEEFDRVAPISFLYERNSTKSKVISRELRKAFLGDGPIDNSSFTGLGYVSFSQLLFHIAGVNLFVQYQVYLYADGLVGFGVNRGVKLVSAKNAEKTYYYCFSFKGRYSYFYRPNTTIPYGTVHQDDQIYWLPMTSLFPLFNATDPEYVMVRKLTTILKNFASTGNPTPSRTNDCDNVLWTPYTLAKNNYMDIGENLQMKRNLYEYRYSVWEKLFPISDYLK